ncbi:unnamed protein product [Owenia fusiformis]|uniref:Uncharacterized protein n=1 Tax=Owenia fusiformis TaxID=6347 RepID=A0A8S4PTB2_OWEFU|nr:unnamed protein product [Owenia fusiformis]
MNNYSGHVKEAIVNGKRKLFSLFGLGHKTGGLSPLVATKLYNSYSIPTMLYGDQLINYKPSDVEMLEVAQRQIGRRLQSLPVHSSNPSATMPLGMNSMSLRIDYDMLLMLFGLLTLPISNIYKQFTITRLIPIIFFKETTWDSPIRQMWDRVRKYNLTELLTNMIVNGIYLTKGSWKRFIKLEVNDKQRAIYRTTCNTYRRHDVCLNICDVKDGATGPLRPCVWWTLAKMKPELLAQCKTMMRLATDSHDFRVKNDGINSTCFLCDMFEIETLDHFFIFVYEFF